MEGGLNSTSVKTRGRGYYHSRRFYESEAQCVRQCMKSYSAWLRFPRSLCLSYKLSRSPTPNGNGRRATHTHTQEYRLWGGPCKCASAGQRASERVRGCVNGNIWQRKGTPKAALHSRRSKSLIPCDTYPCPLTCHHPLCTTNEAT